LLAEASPLIIWFNKAEDLDVVDRVVEVSGRFDVSPA
jgi:hypothetical protein